MSDDALSKRARQKQRRDAKLAEQRQEQAKARRNRVLMFGIVGLIILGLIGLGVFNFLEGRRKEAELRDAAKNLEEALACTPGGEEAQVTSLGGGHIESSE